MKKLYAERNTDSEEFNGLVFDHMMAMIGESLHGKVDIARELAWRDLTIQKRNKEIEELNKGIYLAKLVIDSIEADNNSSYSSPSWVKTIDDFIKWIREERDGQIVVSEDMIDIVSENWDRDEGMDRQAMRDAGLNNNEIDATAGWLTDNSAPTP